MAPPPDVISAGSLELMMIPDYPQAPRPLKAIGRTLLQLLDRPLAPASAAELELGNQLRSGLASLDDTDAGGLEPSSKAWSTNITRLKSLIEKEDPRAFLRWDVIRDTMFVVQAPYSWNELRYLRARRDWRRRWAQAIRESRVGRPLRLPFYPATSGNLLHHAYHLARFEEATLLPAHQFSDVVEFGGGYGSMCRLFFNLGFKGRYVIFDLPAFSYLQKYYLSSLGLTVSRELSVGASVSCVSDIRELLHHISQLGGDGAIFIATWSLSVASEEDRQPLETVLRTFSAVLIAFQERFGEVDNRIYFDRLRSSIAGMDWRSTAISHLPGNYYLFGRRVRVEGL